MTWIMFIQYNNCLKQTTMLKLWKFIKGVYDIQLHVLPLTLRKVVYTPMIIYIGKHASGIELFSLDSPSMEYNTYCLLGVHLDYAPNDELILVEVRLLWLFQFTISFKVQD